ncbi:catalase-like isoform X2 [Rhodnius prolixus]|uniref:catalase-like isoform X2 n=1 Tax=Rhodnius prolixus TaxID=13249 RepID=UPI003D18B390
MQLHRSWLFHVAYFFTYMINSYSANNQCSRDSVSNQLINYYKQHQGEVDTLTTESGNPVDDVNNILTVGARGPLLVEDLVYFDVVQHFDRERIPERVVHAKGAGAFGYFIVTDDAIARYTKATVFSHVGKKTPLMVRFSTVIGERGSADSARDPRGFAVKFYTEDGIWDLVGNNTPVFFTRDPLMFFKFIHSQKRNPVTNLKDMNMIWDFFTLRPESTYQLLIHYSDRGTPDGFRHMHGYGSNTYKLVNAEGIPVYCKFHYRTDQGFRNLTADVAQRLMMDDPDYATRDLYNAIEEKRYPSWTFYIQVMTFKQAEMFRWNPFDVTKIWPEDEYPLIEVGKIVLDRNPTNYFADVEQAGFSPSNMIPGIEPSPDKMLQGRLFSYKDTHFHRLGTNHLQLPVNSPFRTKVANLNRDGYGTYTDNQNGAPTYYPSSFRNLVGSPNAIRSHYTACGDVARYNSSDDDNYSQPAIFWRDELTEDDRVRLVQNMAQDLRQASPFLWERALTNLHNVDVRLSSMLAAALA